MNRLIVIIVVLFVQKLSFCQSSDFIKDSLLAIEYYDIANDSSHNVPLCFRYNELAKPLLIKTKQWEKYVYILLTNNYCYKNLGGTERWEKNNKLAVEEAERLLGPSHFYYSVAINNLGDFYKSNKEDYPKAKAFFLSALNTFKEKTDGISMLTKAGIYQNLGFVSKAEGDYNTALSFFNQAYDHFQKGFVLTKADITSNFRLALVNRNIAEILIQQKKYEEAIMLLKESINKIKPFPKSQKYQVLLNSYITKIYIEKNDLPKAKYYLEKANSFSNSNKDQKASLIELEAIIFKAF